jgi:ankyrin repeat protein
MVTKILKHVLGIAFLMLCAGGVCAPEVSPTSGTLQQSPSPFQNFLINIVQSIGGPDNRSIDKKKWPLHEAAARGHLETVKSRIASGVDPNAKDSEGLSPIHYAAYWGHLEPGRFLLDHGADINARTKQGRTPLYLASLMGRVSLVKLLLAHKADIETPDEKGASPLFVAVWENRRDIAVILLDAGANVNVPDKRGIAPLHAAARSGRAEMVELLLARGADPNTMPSRGFGTPLHFTAFRGQIEVAENLLAHGARINAKDDKSGVTPLHLAACAHQDGMVFFLKSRGADDTIQDKLGLTPARLAALMQESETRQLLTPPDVPKTFDQRAIVVLIVFEISDNEMSLAWATGAAIGNGSVVVTAAHVTREKGFFRGLYAFSPYSGKVCEPEILALDQEKDVAILRVPWGRHPALIVATEEELARAKEMIVAGYVYTENEGQESQGSLKKPMMERFPVLKVFPEDDGYRCGAGMDGETGSMGLALGGGKFAGPGWSGSPILLPESGRLGGVQCRWIRPKMNLVQRYNTGQPVRQDKDILAFHHLLGANVHSIRALLRRYSISDAASTSSEIPAAPADAQAAFETLADIFQATVDDRSSLLLPKLKTYYHMRPDSPVGYLLAGWSLAGTAVRDKDDPKSQAPLLSETCFKSALTLSPKSALVHAGCGHLLHVMGREKEAIVEFDKYLAIRPDEPFVQSEKKRARESLSRKKSAEDKANPVDFPTSRSLEKPRKP